MKFYEHDADGWLIGWHEDADRPRSTPLPPPLPVHRARWVADAWVTDTSRHDQREADEATNRTKAQQAIAICRAYDPATATAAEVRQTLGATLFLLKKTIQGME